MPDFNFSQSQRQSSVGLVLIFATSLYHIARNLWVVVFYLAVREIDQKTIYLAGAGLGLLIILSLGYSIVYFMNFKFHVDETKEAFILQKGVFSTDVVNIPFRKIQQVNFKRNILQRIIGVYSVVIETAGSQDKEVEIKALSKDRATALADLLMSHSEAEEQDIPFEGEEILEDESIAEKSENPVDWEFKIKLWTLVKLGLSSNYLRGIGILFAFYFTLKEQFMFNEELSAQLDAPEQFWSGSKLLLIIFLLIIGMFFTVGETVVKYYGLHLKKRKDTLQVEMGLRNNTRVNLRASRIQMLQVLTNPIQRRMQLYQIKISLASSENDIEKNQIKIVGLTPEIVAQVKEYFYKEKIAESFSVFPSKYLLLRSVIRGVIPAIFLIGILYFFVEQFSINYLVAFGVGGLMVITTYTYLYFRSLELGVSKDFLIKRSGVWIKKEEYLELFRLQAVSVSQPIWYKKRGLVNLIFHSAGGDISYQLVRREQIAHLINYLLYKIESTDKSWM